MIDPIHILAIGVILALLAGIILFFDHLSNNSMIIFKMPVDRKTIFTRRGPKAKEATYAVLASLRAMSNRQRSVTVGDFSALAGLPLAWQDDRYGWTNFDKAYVKCTVDGWVLVLPPAILLPSSQTDFFRLIPAKDFVSKKPYSKEK